MKKSSHKRLHIVWFNLYEVCRTGKYIEIESRLLVDRVWSKEFRVTSNMYQVSFCGKENFLKLDSSTGYITVNILNTTEYTEQYCKRLKYMVRIFQ